MDDGGEPPAARVGVSAAIPKPETPNAPKRSARRSWIGLLSIVVAFAAVYTILSQIRYEAFFATTWDLGLNMQMLWTNTHGHLLYEAGDFEVARANSFLFIHPTFVAVPVSWLYAVSPTATTLFALQGAAVAFSAVPLYLIGRRADVSEKYLLLGVAVYLASFPILSALLYDFHWECLIPAEFLWTYYLWARGRFWLALVPVILGTFTLEVFPILLIGLVIYFAYPFLVRLAQAPRAALRRLRDDPRRAAPLAGLLAIAVVGHLALDYFSGSVLAHITGLAPIYPAASSKVFLYVYYWGVSGSTIGPRLLYWLLLVGGFGFLPLLARQRLLLLSLPWFLYSVVMSPYSSYTKFGFQYSFIAIAPLAIAFIEALGPLAVESSVPSPRPGSFSVRELVLSVPLLVASLVVSLSLLNSFTPGLEAGLAVGAAALCGYVAFRFIPRTFPASRPSQPKVVRENRAHWNGAGKTVTFAVIGVLIATNVAMSPLNPANYQGPGLGGYSFTYTTSPVYDHMANLVSKITPGETLLASSNLFPFVANDAKAYSLYWYPATPEYLPFNSSVLPMYVLLSSSQWFAVPSYLSDELFQPSQYGLVEMIYSSAPYPGSVYLYERGYTGPSDIVEVNPFPSQLTLCGSDLVLGPSGVIVSQPGTACGVVIQSQPSSNLSGSGITIWYGPYVNLLAGHYTVTVSLRGYLPVSGGPTNAPIVLLDASADGTGYWYSAVIGSNQISMTAWTDFTYQFDLAEPHPNAEWRGYLDGPTLDGQFTPGFVQLNEIIVQYSP